MLLKGFAVSGALLNLLGAACGLGCGAFYIKKNWVDCEGFDFFSAMAGNEGKREEREHLDREAASLVNDVYRTKLGPANGSTVEPKPMLAFALQPAMADIGDFESLFGGLDNAPLQSDILGSADTAESRIIAVETAAQDRRFDDTPELLQSVRELNQNDGLSHGVLKIGLSTCWRRNVICWWSH